MSPLAALILKSTLAALAVYGLALGGLGLWFARCASQGRDPSIRSPR